MTRARDSAEAELDALRRFFLLRYHDEIRKRYPIFQGMFPLAVGSRLDLVHVNGAARVHFVYRAADGGTHLVVVHDLTLEVGQASAEAERRLVTRAIGAEDSLVHFVVRPPFRDRFEAVEEEAVAAVARHARLPRRS